MEGIIVKGIGGFYYVDDGTGNVLECRAAGSLRNKKIKPAVGDRAVVENGEHEGNLVTDILPRTNYIKRPPAANIGQILIVCALTEPRIDYLLLDKLIMDSTVQGAEVVLCITKCDLAGEEERRVITDNYSAAADRIVFTSSVTGEGLDEVKELLRNNVSLLRGVSGAGKTSLLNAICPDTERETGELSRKLKRGKNTTRHTELTAVEPGSFILDTPGFSDFELEDMKETELWKHYPEFYEHSDCRYLNCMHLSEPGCMVKEAVASGEISSLRYENYKKLYAVLKKKNQW